MQINTNGQRNITLDFDAPKKFKLKKDGAEIPYIRTGKNSFRLGRNIDGVLDLEEVIEQPRIVKPMQLQAQQMALVNPNDVLMINQAAQQLEVEQNILSETQKRVEQTQAYLDIQQQRINESVLSVQGLETDNSERITATENGIFNLAGELAKAEGNSADVDNYIISELDEHKTAENPHGITKETIGLNKVDNTSDLDKPISKAVQSALDEKADKDEIQAIRDELGEYQEKNDRFTNALSNYTGGLAGNQLPDGGLEGQILAKRSDMSGDAEWVDSSASITVDDELSLESENPVQNKVITNALNEKADISDIPTVNNATLAIQKNGTSVGTFSANASEDVNINLIIPTTASDVSALPDSTKYGAGLSLTINSTNYVMTAQLKDQDGNNLGTVQTIDLPLESVVVSGSYDSVNKKIVLTLQNGTTIDIPVGDLVSGLQTEITENNKLNADLVDDSTSTNKFVTASDITTWNGKQDAISDLATIRSGAALGATAVQPADLSTYVTTNTAQDITARKTFFGEKAIYFKQSTSSNKLGFTLYNNNNKEVGALEFRPNTSGIPILTLNSSSPSGLGFPYVGFRYWNYSLNILAPFSTSLRNKNFFIPVTFTNGTTTVESTSTDGSVNISSLLPTKTSDLANDSGYITASDLPTVNNATLTITQGGVSKGTFTANASSDVTIALDSGGSSLTAGTGIDITNDVISVEGVKDQRNTSTAIKTWTGTRAQYDAIVSKDSNTLYNITDDTDTTLTLLEALYPVGSVYITTASTCPLSTLISGSSWQLVSSGRVLQGADNGHSAGTTIEAGLPNITGNITPQNLYNEEVPSDGVFTTYAGSASQWTGSAQLSRTIPIINFDASRSNQIYGNSNTVQPPAYVVNIFRRTL